MVVGGDQEHPLACGRDVFGPALAAGADRRKPAGHRLHVRDPERLLDAWHHVKVTAPGLDERLRVGELAQEANPIANLMTTTSAYATTGAETPLHMPSAPQ